MKLLIEELLCTCLEHLGLKSFMIGINGVSWLQFSEDLIAKFGELDTDLVFENFNKLQQTKSVEEYYDEFERCRGATS